MMRGQSLEFNIGYAFNSIERAFIRHMRTDGFTKHIGTVSVPKTWFGLPSSNDDRVDISIAGKWEMEHRLMETFRDLAPQYDLEIEEIKPERRYIDINYKIVKKEPIKKMTVEEIEKALGYKVEIVS